ncbi:TPA: hypothetical protein R4558_000527 [Campylobacter jejuni]|uniref:hypothetical protein n=1 Tax=Campylobacter TaxID=194 RepID=UPI000257EBD8|nr:MULTISPECIES: hypothetical protein [Campylobacter]ATD41104.1 Uncharacterized protein CLH93_0486 [Campylobacter jejuni]AVS36965.1 hypothetical protein C9J79_04895 [Campylobacter jejuni]EAB5261914.1 hypothetical protein [Campylobacter jejuni]EAB5314281.1 hypothetical protein [Campylobacter jejuni]EAC1329633.1 hypothetical protein [Campylobacter jejuni]
MEEKQKTNKSEIISIRLDTVTKNKLAYICELEYRPMALQIRKIIEDYINTYESENSLWQKGDYPN